MMKTIRNTALKPMHHEIRCVGIALLLMACLGLAGCEATNEVGAPSLRSVRTMTVEPTSAGTQRTFSGTSRSKLESRLSFKVSGTLQTLPIKVGDRLRRGQLIGRLDASLYELEAQQAEASLVQAQAGERNAKAAYQRVKELYADNNAPRNDLDAARANAESGEAQVRAASKQLELARLNASYARLTAADDCTVMTVEVEVNENVSPGGTVATVSCGSDLEVVLSVPESLISRVQEGMTATARFDAVPGVELNATVAEVGVSASGSAFPVTVAIDDEDGLLRSGLAAEVTFQFSGDDRGDRYLVPLASLVKDGAGSFVYILEPGGDGQGTVRRQDVELGELTEEGMEVLVGLNPGDQVVTAGTSVIRDGLTVAISASVALGNAGA